MSGKSAAACVTALTPNKSVNMRRSLNFDNTCVDFVLQVFKSARRHSVAREIT